MAKARLDRAREELKKLGLKEVDKWLSNLGEDVDDIFKIAVDLGLSQKDIIILSYVNKIKDKDARSLILRLIKEGRIKPSHLYNNGYIMARTSKDLLERFLDSGISPKNIVPVINAMGINRESAEKAIKLWKEGYVPEDKIGMAADFIYSRPDLLTKLMRAMKERGIPKEYFLPMYMAKTYYDVSWKKMADLIHKYSVKPDYLWRWVDVLESDEKIATRLLEAVKDGKLDERVVVPLVRNKFLFHKLDEIGFDNLEEKVNEAINNRANEKLEGYIKSRDYPGSEKLVEEEQILLNRKDIDKAIQALRDAISAMGEKRIQTPSGSLLVPEREVITRDEVLKIARKNKNYVKGLESIIPEKLEYAGAYKIIQKLYASKESRMPTGALVKTAVGAPLESDDFYKKVKTLVLYPKTSSGLEWWPSLMPGSIGYAKVYPVGKTLIVYNIQSEVFSPKSMSNAKIRKKLKEWKHVLMDAVEEYARRHGFERVAVTPARFQIKRWRFSPDVMHEIYTELPYSRGYKLKETRPYKIDNLVEKIFWVKELPSEGKPSVLKMFPPELDRVKPRRTKSRIKRPKK